MKGDITESVWGQLELYNSISVDFFLLFKQLANKSPETSLVHGKLWEYVTVTCLLVALVLIPMTARAEYSQVDTELMW